MTAVKRNKKLKSYELTLLWTVALRIDAVMSCRGYESSRLCNVVVMNCPKIFGYELSWLRIVAPPVFFLGVSFENIQFLKYPIYDWIVLNLIALMFKVGQKFIFFTFLTIPSAGSKWRNVMNIQGRQKLTLKVWLAPAQHCRHNFASGFF